MSQSLSRVWLHLVYSTKNRTPWLRDPAVREDLYAYMATTLNNIECPTLKIGGVEDHLHILCGLSRKIAIKDLVEEAKTGPSKWIKTKGDAYRDFHWQGGYGVFSVSESNVAAVKEYIEKQEEHHRTMSFQDEFRLLCQRHQIEIDERYVWD